MSLLLTSTILHIIPEQMHYWISIDERDTHSAPAPTDRHQARTTTRRRTLCRRGPWRLPHAARRARARSAGAARHDAEDPRSRFGRLGALSRAARGRPGQYLDRAAAPSRPGDEPAAGRAGARRRGWPDRTDADPAAPR